MTVYTANFPAEHAGCCGTCTWCRYGTGCRHWDPFHPMIWGSVPAPEFSFADQRYPLQVW